MLELFVKIGSGLEYSSETRLADMCTNATCMMKFIQSVFYYMSSVMILVLYAHAFPNTTDSPKIYVRLCNIPIFSNEAES